MVAMASPGGMIPEQVWDADPIPRHFLLLGEATGSAMPLAWAHAEFVKLLVSSQLGRAFDRPEAVWQRYRGRPPHPECAFWWPQAAIGSMPAGARLVVALPEPAIVHWGIDGWHSATDTPAADTGLGFCAAPLDTTDLPAGSSIDFTWRKPDGSEWAGCDYGVAVIPAQQAAASFTTLQPASRAAK